MKTATNLASETVHKFNPELRKKIAEAAKTKAVGWSGEAAKTPLAEDSNNTAGFEMLTGFSFANSKVRIYTPQKGEYWFCLVDLCKILGYKDSEEAFKKHCLNERTSWKPEGATKSLYYIGEKDLYNLMLRSNSPNALPFRKLVTGKILPEIRESGRCMLTREDDKIAAAKAAPALPDMGEQLEMFPITASGKVTFGKEAIDSLSAARKKLAERGETFETYNDFLGYLIDAGLKAIK